MEILVKDEVLAAAAAEGMDAFLKVFTDAYRQAAGEGLTLRTFQELTADQVTLLGYSILRDELMDGGFIQLIQNGYGPFFFDNPFAKAMRLWGLKEFSKVLYRAKEVYDKHRVELTRERTDEEFMALYEQFGVFDELDDWFVTEEEGLTSLIACYVDEHLEQFAKIV